MRTVKHMPFYGQQQTERFQMRVPAGFKYALSRYIGYRNQKTRQIKSAADFLIYLASRSLAKEEAFCKALEAEQKKLQSKSRK